MKKSILLSLNLIICVAIFAQSSVLGDKTLPNINVKDLNGGTVDVSSFAKNDKITVVNFWATWCSPCKKELNNLNDLYEDWVKDYDMEIVAISIDDARNVAKSKSYFNGQDWDFIGLIDVNQDLKRALNFQTIPYTLLLDKTGKIVYTHTGYVEGDEFLLEEKIEALK